MCSLTGAGSITGMCSMPMLYQANALANGDQKGHLKDDPYGDQKGDQKRNQKGIQHAPNDKSPVLKQLFLFWNILTCFRTLLTETCYYSEN